MLFDDTIETKTLHQRHTNIRTYVDRRLVLIVKRVMRVRILSVLNQKKMAISPLDKTFDRLKSTFWPQLAHAEGSTLIKGRSIISKESRWFLMTYSSVLWRSRRTLFGQRLQAWTLAIDNYQASILGYVVFLTCHKIWRITSEDSVVETVNRKIWLHSLHWTIMMSLDWERDGLPT